jgi:hypothetical protein
MRLWKLLTVLPLALMLAACLQTSRPSAGQASVVVAAAAPLPGVDSEDEGYVQMAALNSFPSSASPARGTPWKTMHRDGNRASFQENCDLLGLTPSACRQYSEKLDRNQCVTMTLPNGVILDRLTFTRNGRHQAQRSVLVAITNVPANHLDRTATVCDIGGVYVGRIHGCGNYFRVDARGAAPPVVIAPVPQVRVDGACAPSRRDGSMRLFCKPSGTRASLRGSNARRNCGKTRGMSHRTCCEARCASLLKLHRCISSSRRRTSVRRKWARRSWCRQLGERWSSGSISVGISKPPSRSRVRRHSTFLRRSGLTKSRSLPGPIILFW